MLQTNIIDSETIRRSLNIDLHDLALMAIDGSWELIRSSQFVRASRSAIRESAESSRGSVPC